jgi:hypothetical protein
LVGRGLDGLRAQTDDTFVWPALVLAYGSLVLTLYLLYCTPKEAKPYEYAKRISI